MDYKDIFNKITPQAKKNIKRTIIAGAICAIIGGGASAYASYATNIKGTVTAINGQSVTVQDKFSARTVNLAGSAFDAAQLRKGERIDIERSINGAILKVKVKDYGHRKDHSHYKRGFEDHYDHNREKRSHYEQHDHQHLSVSEQAARAQYMAEHDASQKQNAAM